MASAGMKMLIVADRLGRAGGMERYLEVMLPALAARGISIHVLARTLDSVPPSVTAERIAWSDEHAAPDDAARVAMQGAIAAFAPQLAIAHNVMDAGLVEALRTVPRFAYHIHDHRPFCPNGDRLFPRTGRICTSPLGRACLIHALTDGCGYGPRLRTLALVRRRERLRNAIAAADSVIVASHYVAERARANAIPTARIVELPNPLPAEAYLDGPRVAGESAVLFAGRVVPQKGLLSLVRALAHVPAQRRPVLRVLGDGPALRAARQHAVRCGVTLDAAGIASPPEVRAAIDRAALVVLPSLWAEPFGMIGIEAFARACPVVAYDVGGVRAWLDDGENGAAVPAGDERALGAAIDGLIGDEALRLRLGRRARQDAERYRVEPIVDVLLSATLG